MVTGSRELRQAYAACQQLAQSHYENFPVASRLMPAHLRPHAAAIYAFARIADDFADEPGREPEERIRLLADWKARLHSALAGRVESRQEVPPDKDQPPGNGLVPDRVFLALADTVTRFDLPVSLLDDLLSAFNQDVTTTRYATWADVFDYCRRSANPVGRLVLRLSGYRDDQLDRASDAVCTALQLTNFWQDLAVDWSRGRLYVPEETWRPRGADPVGLNDGRMEGDDARLRAANARVVWGGPRGLRRRLRALALRTARDVAWRHAHSRPDRPGRVRRLCEPAGARRG